MRGAAACCKELQQMRDAPDRGPAGGPPRVAVYLDCTWACFESLVTTSTIAINMPDGRQADTLSVDVKLLGTLWSRRAADLAVSSS